MTCFFIIHFRVSFRIMKKRLLFQYPFQDFVSNNEKMTTLSTSNMSFYCESDLTERYTDSRSFQRVFSVFSLRMSEPGGQFSSNFSWLVLKCLRRLYSFATAQTVLQSKHMGLPSGVSMCMYLSVHSVLKCRFSKSTFLFFSVDSAMLLVVEVPSVTLLLLLLYHLFPMPLPTGVAVLLLFWGVITATYLTRKCI